MNVWKVIRFLYYIYIYCNEYYKKLDIFVMLCVGYFGSGYCLLSFYSFIFYCNIYLENKFV